MAGSTTANSLVGTWDPKLMMVNFGGIIFGGYADGTFLNIAPHAADFFTKVVGADGEVQRSKSADNTHQITFTALQGSDTNEALSNELEIDKETGANKKPLTITDMNSGLTWFWPEAWIRGDPELPMGKEAQDRQWIIDTGQRKEGGVAGIQR